MHPQLISYSTTQSHPCYMSMTYWERDKWICVLLLGRKMERKERAMESIEVKGDIERGMEKPVLFIGR